MSNIQAHINSRKLNIRDQKISAEVLITNDEIENIRIEWFHFWKINPYHNPFNSPDWLIPWIKYFGNEQQFLIIFRDNSRIVGFIPLYIFTSDDGQRRLKITGTGNSDYLDLLIEPLYSEQILEMTFRFIDEIKDRFDIFEIQGQRPGSLLLSYVYNTPGTNYKMISEEVSPNVDLLPDFESYITTLPGQFRKNTKRAERELSSWNFEIAHAHREDTSEFFENLVTLHQAEWSRRNEKGVLYDDTVLKFLNEVIINGIKNKTAAIYSLKNNSEFAAVDIIFYTANTAFYYIGAYNPEFEKYSPGSVLLWKIIRESISCGITRFDFLKGGEHYKYKWGARDISVYGIVLSF